MNDFQKFSIMQDSPQKYELNFQFWLILEHQNLYQWVCIISMTKVRNHVSPFAMSQTSCHIFFEEL